MSLKISHISKKAFCGLVDELPEDFALGKDNQQGGIQLAQDAAQITMAPFLRKNEDND